MYVKTYAHKTEERQLRCTMPKTQPAPLSELIPRRREWVAKCAAELEEAKLSGNPALVIAKEHILLQMQKGLEAMEREYQAAQDEARKRELLDTPHWED